MKMEGAKNVFLVFIIMDITRKEEPIMPNSNKEQKIDFIG